MGEDDATGDALGEAVVETGHGNALVAGVLPLGLGEGEGKKEGGVLVLWTLHGLDKGDLKYDEDFVAFVVLLVAVDGDFVVAFPIDCACAEEETI